MLAPNVAYSSLNYVITFTAPTSTGGTAVDITGYDILFLQKDGTYSAITAECDGMTDATIISTRTC